MNMTAAAAAGMVHYKHLVLPAEVLAPTYTYLVGISLDARGFGLIAASVALNLSFSARHWACKLAVVAAVCAFIFFNPLEINTANYYPHVLTGIMAKELGTTMLGRSYDGGPVTVRTPLVPAVGSFAMMACFINQVFLRKTPEWSDAVHGLFYFLTALLFASISLGTWLVQRAAKDQHEDDEDCEEPSETKLPFARPASGLDGLQPPRALADGGSEVRHPMWRYVHDPTVMIAMALVMLRHSHDHYGRDAERYQVRNVWHTMCALLLMGVGVAMLLSFLTSSALGLPRSHTLRRATAFVHAFMWMLIGWCAT